MLILKADLVAACSCGQRFPKSMGILIDVTHAELQDGIEKRSVGLVTCAGCGKQFPVHLKRESSPGSVFPWPG